MLDENVVYAGELRMLEKKNGGILFLNQSEARK